MPDSVVVIGSNVGATHETNEPPLDAALNAAKSVWYSWTASTAGTVRVLLLGSGFDTLLAVYSGVTANGAAADAASLVRLPALRAPLCCVGV